MYFKEKEDTNIDSEFKNNTKLNLDKKTLFIIGGVLLLVVIIIIVVITLMSSDASSKYTLELLGQEEVYINLGDDYIEPGYKALDKDGNDVNNLVKITSDIDYTKAGTYEIVYTVDGVSQVRYVIILEKKEDTDIYLLGDLTIYLKVGDTYKEPGYNAVDVIDQNIKDKVIVTGTVNTSKKGVYKITYTVTNSRNETFSKVRTVVVE